MGLKRINCRIGSLEIGRLRVGFGHAINYRIDSVAPSLLAGEGEGGNGEAGICVDTYAQLGGKGWGWGWGGTHGEAGTCVDTYAQMGGCQILRWANQSIFRPWLSYQLRSISHWTSFTSGWDLMSLKAFS